MKKTFINLTFSLLLLFVFTESVHALENDSDYKAEVIESEEISLDLDLQTENHVEVTYEEDGTETTISLTRELHDYNAIKTISDSGIIGTQSLTPGQRYRYRYEKDKYTKYSYVITLTNTSPVKIASLSDLQFDWSPGIVKTYYARKLTATTGRAQLVYDRTGTIKGTATETSNVILINTGRGGRHQMQVTRNNSTVKHIISDETYN